MNKRKTMTLGTGLAALLLLVLSVAGVTAFATIVPDVWEPTTTSWINGNADGYSEGEVVPVRYQITDTEGTNSTFSACLDMTVSNNGAYGFSDVEPWDTDYLPNVTPPVPGNLGSVVGDGFQIENGTINSATFEGLSDGNAPFLCPENHLEWALDITLPTDGVGSDDETATLVYGAKLAAPGDTTANGDTVPDGLGASAIKGTFQIQLANGGSETINFQGPDIAPASGGRIVVIKDASPADGTDFDFTLTEENAGLISQFTLDDAVPDDNDGIDDTAVFNVPAGTYTLDELTPAGWSQTGLVCTSEDGIVFNYIIDQFDTVVEFPLGDGEQAVCTFTNTRDIATLIVQKSANPQDGTDFPFTISPDARTILYREIYPVGTYSGVTQSARLNALEEGWRGYWDGMVADGNPAPQNTTRLQIFTGGSTEELPVNSSPFNAGTGGQAFWSPSESRVILYTEEFSFPRAELAEIYYETRHNPGDQPQQDFPLLKIDGKWYSPDCQFVNTDVPGNATWIPASWIVNSVTWMELDIDPATNRAVVPGQDCVQSGDFDPPLQTGLSFANLGNTVEAFGLYLPDPESNPQANMRFDNYTFYGQPTGNFTLDDANPDDSDGITNEIAFELPTGSYTVAEQVPNGWLLESIDCGDGIVTDQNDVDVNLQKGDEVTCTFTNVAEGKIIVGKYHDLNMDAKWQTNDEPGLQGWTFNLYLSDSGYQLEDTKVTGPNGFVTFSGLIPGADYKICEVLQPGWINTQADKLAPGTSPGPLGNVNEVCSDIVNPEPGVNYQARFGNYQQPTGNFCPTDTDNVDFLLTDVLGSGMGGPNVRAKRTVKLVVPNYQDVATLYGQLAAVDVGQMRFARFRYPDTSYIQIKDPTSPAFTAYAVSWWGSDLEPSPYIKGQFRWRASASRSPRAFVLWPTYNTEVEYANVLELFDNSSTNHVFWDESGAYPWIAEQTQTLVLPTTQSAGADILVKVALVDNNGDNRPVILTVSANGVVVQSVTFGPNKKDTLNLEEFVLENVPAGTSEVVLHLLSPAPDQTYPDGGDSVAMIGAAASYLCIDEELNGPDPVAPSPANTGR